MSTLLQPLVADSEPSSPSAPTGRRLAILEVLLIGLVFFVQAGWPVPEVNEPHYLGKAKHYWNPDWCRGDFFLESADAHQTFYWCFGWLTLILPLPAVAWCGRILTWSLLAIAWRRLSFLIVPRAFASVLSAALFVTLLDRFNLAGEWVVGGVEAKGFAYALVLLALSEIMLGKWNRVWLLLGAASAWHVLVGGWSVVAAGLTFWCEGKCRPPVLSQWKGLLAGGLLALVGLLPAIWLTRDVDPATVAEANQIYVFGRLPHHLALHVLKPAELQTRLFRNSLSLGTFLALVWILPKSSSKKRIGLFVFATILMALSGAVISFVLRNHPERAAGILRFYWYRLSDFALPMGTSLFSIGVVAQWLKSRRAVGTLLLVVLMIFCAIQLGQVTLRRYSDPRPPADRKMADAADWRTACYWVRDHLPSDACFLTPRGSHTFKWYAQRQEVVNQKDIPQDAASIVEWQTRLNDLFPEYNSESGMKRISLGRQSAAELLQLSKKYGAGYLITPKSSPLPFPQLYQNNTYIVYELTPPAEELNPAAP